MRRTAEIKYREYWVIRVIEDNHTSKRCTREVILETPPTEQEVLEELIKCKDNEFINVAHNYKLD